MPRIVRTRFLEGSNDPVVIVAASADNTHFVDQYGQPRLFVCEDVWGIAANAGAWNSGDYEATFDTYFAQRAAQGYTAAEVSWCSYPQSIAAFVFDDGRDWDGAWPFTTTMNPTTAANETYWVRRDYMFAAAASNGITVVLNTTTPFLSQTPAPAQTSWSTAQWQAFGTFLGDRYQSTPNILWIVGDDYFGELDTGLNAWLATLRATGDTHLVSIQCYQEATSRQDIFDLTKDPLAFCEHAQYEWGYSYNPSYDVVEKAQTYTPTAADDVQGVVPPLWGDGFYLASGVGGGQTDVRLERQMIWWALSSGACGFSTGDNDIWKWASGAAAAVTSKTFYTAVMPAIVEAFGGLADWQKLTPDTSNLLVTAGRGTHVSPITSGGSGTPYTANSDNYVTASRTSDTGSGSALAVIYKGLAMNITIDESKMVSGYTATWVDPVNGATTAGTEGSTYNSTSQVGNNSAGDPDWVLILRGP